MMESFKAMISGGKAAELSELIEAHPEVLADQDDQGRSGFLIIAYNRMPEVFEKAKRIKTTFTFYEAIVAGRQDLVANYLAANKALVNMHSPDGFTPLSLAAFFDEAEMAKLLLEHGADPSLQATNDFKVNALHSAVAKNNVELCKLFIAHKADVNICQAQNVTPLHAAAHHGNLVIVKLLVDNGARIDVQMDNGRTPIDFAESDGHGEVREFLQQSLKKSEGKDL